MIKHFAVDPQAMGNSWTTFLYLIEKFGFDRGRIIARLPREWEREVEKAAKEANIPDVRLASITHRLRNAARFAVSKRSGELNPAIGDWKANAIHGADRGAYDAVISNINDTKHRSVLVADEISEDTALFKAWRTWEVPRTIDGICNSAMPLLMNAKAVLIVDPYFNVQSRGQDFLGPLRAILQTVNDSGISGCKVQVHFATIDKNPNLDFYEQNLEKLLRPILPLPRQFELYEWAQQPNGIRFHDRYLLTDCGGLSFGAGFSAVGSGDQLNVGLLDWDDCNLKVSRLLPKSSAFVPVGLGLQINVDGTSKRIPR